MKKLILLTILLGLTGCGDNNQSDTQTSSQANTLQKAELTPALANYSLAASPRTMSAVAPLQGWNVTQSTVMGASTLIDAAKDIKISAALITPNAKQVAEVLRGGAAGFALSIAVEQLLGAVDWVMDPANNQIKYKVPIADGSDQTCQKSFFFDGKYYCNVQTACKSHAAYFIELYGSYVSFKSASVDSSGNARCVMNWYGSTNVFTLPLINRPEQTLSLVTIAEKVISNADAGSLDAQVATNLAAQNILNDVVQAEPVVQELENNARNNCPSGITNNGSCWVCSRESWAPIRSRVVYAKEVVFGLNKCSVAMNSSQLLTRYKAYSELGSARDAENACWSPQNPEHLDEAIKAKATAAECNTYLGVLGQ